MAKSSFWKMAGISLAIALVFTGCDDVLTQLKDEIKLGQQTKQEKLDFSLVLENTEPEARYSAVIYGTDGAPVAGAEGTPLADDGVVFAFLVLPGEYDLKVTEKTGTVKTTKTDSVVFADGLFKVVIGWDELLEADAAEEPVSDEEEAVEETETEDEAVTEEPEAVEDTDTEEEAATEEPEAVEETDTEEEAVADEPEAVEETDTEEEEEAVAEEPEAVEETDTEEEAVTEEPEAVEDTDTEEEAALPNYRFTLNPDDRYFFPDAEVGYGPQTPATFTVRNSGNRPTGDLSVELLDGGSGSFVLSTDSIPSIPVDGTATFTVVPVEGLVGWNLYMGKTHTAGIVVRSRSTTGSILWNVFSHVYFTVTPPQPDYGVHVFGGNVTDDIGTVWLGYNIGWKHSLYVYNIGIYDTGPLTVTLSGANPNVFKLEGASIPNIAPDSRMMFKISPVFHLPIGTYTATVTISGANIVPDVFSVELRVVEPGSEPEHHRS